MAARPAPPMWVLPVLSELLMAVERQSTALLAPRQHRIVRLALPQLVIAQPELLHSMHAAAAQLHWRLARPELLINEEQIAMPAAACNWLYAVVSDLLCYFRRERFLPKVAPGFQSMDYTRMPL